MSEKSKFDFFNQIQENILVIDENYHIVAANQTFLTATRQRRENVIGQPCYQISYGLKQPCLFGGQICPLKTVFRTGKPQRCLHTVDSGNGSRKHFDLLFSPITDRKGKVLQVIESGREISEATRRQEDLRESELRFRSIVENSFTGILIVDHQYRIIYANEQLGRILGREVQEIVDKDFREFLDEEVRQWVADYYRRRQEGKAAPPQYEFDILRTDGTKRRVEIRATVIKDLQNRPQTVAQILDVTERIQARRIIEESEKKFRLLFEFAPDAYFLLDAEGCFIDGNKAAEKIIGDRRENLIGKKFSEVGLLLPGDIAAAKREFQQILQGKTTGPHEYEIQRRDGTRVFLEIRTFPTRIGDRTLVLGIAHDVTERKQTQIILEQNNLLLQALLNSPQKIIIFALDREYRYVAFNETHRLEMKKNHGIEIETGLNILEVFRNSEIRQRVKSRFDRALSGESFTEIQYEPRYDIYYEINWNPIRSPEGEIVGLTAFIQDITQRRKVEIELNRLASVIEQASEAIIITDTRGNIEYVNPAFTRITGYQSGEVLGKNPRILKSGKHPPAFYNQLWETISGGNIWRGTLTNKKKDGSIFYEDATIFPIKNAEGEIINFAAVKRDISQERILEEQIQQSQKMEAIGRLAGGVAHDFNNLLTVINGYCDLLLNRLKPGDSFFKEINQIYSAGKRASSLTNQLLAFSRKQIIQPHILNLNTQIRELEKMLRRLIGEDIELFTDLEAELGYIKMDPGQLDQIIMNIVVNARDAMPKGGKLTIETANVVLDKEYVRSHAQVKPGKYVLLAISDTGIGMTKEVMRHIFEPFFTTKGRSKGTGLGLSTVYGIVKQNNGYIWVYSEPGKGTTFKIYLPQQGDATEASSQESTPGDYRGSETILVAEDDVNVRELTVQILKEHGYQVLTASNAGEALSLIDQHRGKVHLLLTDVIMPDLSGRDLVKKLRKKCPDCKVLYMSGYTDNAIVHHGVLDSNTNFIQKPFNPRALLQKVRQVLDRKDNGG